VSGEAVETVRTFMGRY